MKNYLTLRPYSLVAVLLFALIIHVGCRRDSADSGNVVNVRINSEPERLNPILSKEANSLQILSNIFLSPLDFDPKSLELTPVLTKAMPSATGIDTGSLKGGVAYAYEFSDSARWDDGKPVLASDYLFTIKTIFNPKVGANNLRANVDFIKNISIDPQNPRKFTIFCSRRDINVIAATGTIPVLPESVYDPSGAMKKYELSQLTDTSMRKTFLSDSALSKYAAALSSPAFSREKTGVVGCGPYSFEEWKSGQQIVLKKKLKWWGANNINSMLAAYPEKIIYRIIAEEAPLVSQLKDGKIDAASLSPKTFLSLQKNDSTAKLYAFYSAPTLRIAYAGLNCKSPALADKNARRAIAHCFDTKGIIQNVMNGLAEPCVGPFAPSRPYYDKNLAPIPLDIPRAKSLLAGGGWKAGAGDSVLTKTVNGKSQPLTLRCVFPNNPLQKSVALLFQENAKKAGVKVELVSLEAKVFLDALKKRDFDMFITTAAFAPALDDPQEHWGSQSDTPDGSNRYGFHNAQADDLIRQIRAEPNTAKRNDLYRKFQELIYAEQPAVFLFSPNERIVVNKRFNTDVVAKNPGYEERLFRIKE